MTDLEPNAALDVEVVVTREEATEPIVSGAARAAAAHLAGFAIFGTVARELDDARAVVVGSVGARGGIRVGRDASELAVGIEDAAAAVRAAAALE